jgi:hypothetical protein
VEIVLSSTEIITPYYKILNKIINAIWIVGISGRTGAERALKVYASDVNM